jgi:hypothetical protein
MGDNEKHADGIKKSIEDIIGSNAFLKRKKKSDDDIQKEKFEKIIRTLDEIGVRASILENELKIDLSSYDEHFYAVIENLLELHFGKDACELIFFYLYDRTNPDGSSNELYNDDGEVVSLNSPDDLWYVIKMTQERSNKKRK